MIKIGQIGLGHNHGAAKMATIRKFSNLFDVIGIAPENEMWMEKRSNLPAYEGLPILTADEIIRNCDAVLVETEIPLLTQTAQKCADARKHILMDKPASGTLSEFKHLLETAKQNNLVLQLGYMYRYNPAILKCIEKLNNNEFGQITSINAEMSASDPVNYRRWLSQFPGGGMYIFGSHLLDLIIRFMGRPVNVHSLFSTSGKDNLKLKDQALAVLEYPNGMARIYTSAIEINGYGRRQFIISGTKATASILPMERPCRMTWSDTEIAKHHHEDFKVTVPVADPPKECRYDDEVQSFYNYVTGKEKNPWTYEHDYIVQETLLKIIEGEK